MMVGYVGADVQLAESLPNPVITIIISTLVSKWENCRTKRKEGNSTALISYNKRIVLECVYAATTIFPGHPLIFDA